MKRQQVEERRKVDIDERVAVMLKTGYKCAHCGKEIHFGRMGDNLGTVDHFIPLQKGGSNNFVNLIPLCEECNQLKKSKIVPLSFVKYLDEEHKEYLSQYVDEYMKEFKYLSRGNLFMHDQYVMPVYVGPPVKRRVKFDPRLAQGYVLDRVFPAEKDELCDFFVDYLKRYDLFDTDDSARKNIEFWYRFGAIYCIREKDHCIRMMVVVVPSRSRKDLNCLNMHVFSKYATTASCRVMDELPEFLAWRVIKEQEIPYIRMCIAIPSTDKMAKRLGDSSQCGEMTRSFRTYGICHESEVESFDEESCPFYRPFDVLKEELDAFFDQPGYEDYRFMGNMAMPGYFRDEE